LIGLFTQATELFTYQFFALFQELETDTLLEIAVIITEGDTLEEVT
jgi:hypothetical protein